MTVNMVTVTIDVDGSPADPTGPEGNYVFTPSGVMWPDASGDPIVPEIVHGSLALNQTAHTAAASVQLVASDNFAAGVLAWDTVLNVRGMATINVPGLVINFANGATQSIWTLLQSAGWTPENP